MTDAGGAADLDADKVARYARHVFGGAVEPADAGSGIRGANGKHDFAAGLHPVLKWQWPHAIGVIREGLLRAPYAPADLARRAARKTGLWAEAEIVRAANVLRAIAGSVD